MLRKKHKTGERIPKSVFQGYSSPQLRLPTIYVKFNYAGEDISWADSNDFDEKGTVATSNIHIRKVYYGRKNQPYFRAKNKKIYFYDILRFNNRRGK